jgi:DNA polymerase elongation subunit (family B)
MIPKDVLQKCLYFDIETTGLYATFEECQSSEPKLAELWSKRCKWLRANSGPELASASDADLWKEKASLHPEFAKVVCFTAGAYVAGGDIRYMSLIGDENKILTDANKILNNSHTKGLRLAGHTIKNFDIPFLGKRMLAHNIKPSEMINFFGKKPWDIVILDISEVFSFGGWGQSHTSLDLMCYTLGLDSPKDDLSGPQVHEAFYAGRIEDIKKYCEKDVEAVVEIVKKLSF